jgi:hypothetical protein
VLIPGRAFLAGFNYRKKQSIGPVTGMAEWPLRLTRLDRLLSLFTRLRPGEGRNTSDAPVLELRQNLLDFHPLSYSAGSP